MSVAHAWYLQGVPKNYLDPYDSSLENPLDPYDLSFHLITRSPGL